MPETNQIIGVILAGGQGQRMGGVNKGEIQLGGLRLGDIVLGRLAPQVDQVILNAPSGLELGIPIVPDEASEIRGPLAGLLAALKWGRKHIDRPFSIVTVAVDTPLFPEDLVARLKAGGSAALAATGGVTQTTFGYWPETIEGALRIYIKATANSSIRGFAALHDIRLVDFNNRDDFYNINTPEDLARAETMVRGK